MRKVQSSIFIILGTVLLLVALSIVLYNIREDTQGGETSQSIIMEIKSQISETTENTSPTEDTPTDSNSNESMDDEIEDRIATMEQDVREEYEVHQDDEEESEDKDEDEVTVEDPKVYISGDYYLGYITIPSLGLELPIMDELTKKNLKKSPCHYVGSIADGDLIIAGHNYNSHFGRLKELTYGDEIYITSVDGSVYQYEVTQSEIVNGSDVPSMKSGSDSWDLTLFTCTLSGKSRVTVRAVRVENPV